MASPTFDDRSKALALAKIAMESDNAELRIHAANVVANLSIYDILGAILTKVK